MGLSIEGTLYLQPICTISFLPDRDGFPPAALAAARKAANLWASTSPHDRLDTLEPLLSLLLKEGQAKGLLELMKIISPTGGDPWSVVREGTPLGLVGLVIRDPGVPLCSVVLSMLTALVKGNGVIVMSLSSVQMPGPIVQAANSNLPPGLVTFVRGEEPQDAISSLHGKIGLISLIGGRGKGGDLRLPNNSRTKLATLHVGNEDEDEGWCSGLHLLARLVETRAAAYM